MGTVRDCTGLCGGWRTDLRPSYPSLPPYFLGGLQSKPGQLVRNASPLQAVPGSQPMALYWCVMEAGEADVDALLPSSMRITGTARCLPRCDLMLLRCQFCGLCSTVSCVSLPEPRVPKWLPKLSMWTLALLTEWQTRPCSTSCQAWPSPLRSALVQRRLLLTCIMILLTWNPTLQLLNGAPVISRPAPVATHQRYLHR